MNVKLVGPILREEVVPPEEEEFKDFFDYVPIDPGSFFALCAFLIALVVLYPRIKKGGYPAVQVVGAPQDHAARGAG